MSDRQRRRGGFVGSGRLEDLRVLVHNPAQPATGALSLKSGRIRTNQYKMST